MATKREWTILTRATLLARLKDVDDHNSWIEFYHIYSRMIFSVAQTRGLTEAEAKDVVQETISSVAKHMPNFNYDPKLGSFKSWLLQMARWRIIDQYNKRQRVRVERVADGDQSKGCAQADLDDIPASSELEKLWDEEWEKCLLDKATEHAKRKLNPKQYQVYDLSVNKEWPAEKVAQFLAIPIEHVYLGKHRVVEAIRKEVQRLQKEII